MKEKNLFSLNSSWTQVNSPCFPPTGRKDAISENAGSTEMEKRYRSANNGPLLNLKLKASPSQTDQQAGLATLTF